MGDVKKVLKSIADKKEKRAEKFKVVTNVAKAAETASKTFSAVDKVAGDFIVNQGDAVIARQEAEAAAAQQA